MGAFPEREATTERGWRRRKRGNCKWYGKCRGGGGVAEGGWSVQCSQVSAIRSRGPVPWNRVTKPVVRAVRVIGSSHEAEPQTGHTSPSRESKALIRVRSRVTACESQMCIMNLGHETRHESVLGPVSQTGVTGPGHESESRSRVYKFESRVQVKNIQIAKSESRIRVTYPSHESEALN